jgi:hypothetical protein
MQLVPPAPPIRAQNGLPLPLFLITGEAFSRRQLEHPAQLTRIHLFALSDSPGLASL